ncbi:nitronate monooxygenase [Streptomyces sp. NPDC097704]|uniref:nitronate monooxygenase n=1 Tax=Streptomyces sp. NPDC097704 TaxID=3157101 RepID=UPI00332C8205
MLGKQGGAIQGKCPPCRRFRHLARLRDLRTGLERAFAGRSVRALRHRVTDAYEPVAPLGPPAVHHLTGSLRKVAAAANDTDLIYLWAGTGYRQARDGSPPPRLLPVSPPGWKPRSGVPSSG